MLCWHAVSRTSWCWCSLCLLSLFCAKARAEPPLGPTLPPGAQEVAPSAAPQAERNLAPEQARPGDSAAARAPNAYEATIQEALRAYEAGRYAEARNAFRRAYTQNPTARTLRTIGMCSFNLGDYTDAVYQLERALRDPRMPLTAEQQAHARDLIAKADARIGRFRLRLTPPEVVLLVDRKPPLVLEGEELLLEAGHHEIEARAPGYLTAHSTVRVEGGDRTTLVFHLAVDEYAVRPSAVRGSVASQPYAPAPRRPAPEPPVQSGWMRTAGYTSLGLGAASLLGFAVTGTLALADENKLQDRCPNEMCSETFRSTVQRYNTMRTLATVTLIAGGTLTVLGASLLIAQPSETSSPSDRAPQARKLEPIVGWGVLGVRGQL